MIGTRITIPVPISLVLSQASANRSGYRPMARIACMQCGTVADAPSGSKICDCPDEPAAMLTGVATAFDHESPAR